MSGRSIGSPPVRMMMGLANEAMLSSTLRHSSVDSSPA